MSGELGGLEWALELLRKASSGPKNGCLIGHHDAVAALAEPLRQSQRVEQLKVEIAALEEAVRSADREADELAVEGSGFQDRAEKAEKPIKELEAALRELHNVNHAHRPPFGCRFCLLLHRLDTEAKP